MTIPLWLEIARIGESCPQATESSFSAHARAKWERVASYLEGEKIVEFDGKKHAVIMVSHQPNCSCDPCKNAATIMKVLRGEYAIEENLDFTLNRCDVNALHAAIKRRTPLSTSGTSEMPPRPPWGPMLHGTWTGQETTDTLDEQGEAGGSPRRTEGESALRQRSHADEASKSASPSLPPWPKSYRSHECGEIYDPTDVEPWRDAALAKIERLKRDQAEELKAKRAIQDSLPKLYARIAALERDLAEANMTIAMRWPSGEKNTSDGPIRDEPESAGHLREDTTPIHGSVSAPADAYTQARMDAAAKLVRQAFMGNANKSEGAATREGAVLLASRKQGFLSGGPDAMGPLTPSDPSTAWTESTEKNTAQHFAVSQTKEKIENEHEHGRHLRNERRAGGGDEEVARRLQDADVSGRGSDEGTDRRKDRLPRADAARIVGGAGASEARRRDQDDAGRTQEHGGGPALGGDRNDALPGGSDGGRSGRDAPGVLLAEQGTEVALGAECRQDSSQASAPSPALRAPEKWTEEQREAAYDLACAGRAVLRADDPGGTMEGVDAASKLFCAEIAKVAHLFASERATVSREEISKAVLREHIAAEKNYDDHRDVGEVAADAILALLRSRAAPGDGTDTLHARAGKGEIGANDGS